ncbi:MAG: DUF1501 domain-containing protein [Burkholderiales bacterium]
MDRRRFLSLAATSPLGLWLHCASAQDAAASRLLILVELRGANDGLNTVVPFADPLYASLRPRLALKREEVVQLSERAGLHPALEPLLPTWRSGHMAIVEGLGYPEPNLSHFRSIEIWDTASRADEYLQQGWLARAFATRPVPAAYLADGVAIGNNDMGPLAGAPRAIALANPERFLQQARLAEAEGTAARRSSALQHILKVEGNIVEAAANLEARREFRTVFPQGNFGNQVRLAAQIAANRRPVAAIRVSLGNFDTHQNQAPMHGNLLRQLAEGLVALRSALEETGRWESTLIVTYAEFGRRVRENQSQGTDHGTAAAHLVLGGAVRGGFLGQPPALGRLDGNGNLPFAVDFRSLYATVLERWWSLPSADVLGGKFATLNLLRG